MGQTYLLHPLTNRKKTRWAGKINHKQRQVDVSPAAALITVAIALHGGKKTKQRQVEQQVLLKLGLYVI